MTVPEPSKVTFTLPWYLLMGSRREIDFFSFVFLIPRAAFIPELRQGEVLVHE